MTTRALKSIKILLKVYVNVLYNLVSQKIFYESILGKVLILLDLNKC